MGGGGFEPPKQFAADLQSVSFGHSGTHPYSIVTDDQKKSPGNDPDRVRTDDLRRDRAAL